MSFDNKIPTVSGVYAIEHASGKRYVGSAKNLARRRSTHLEYLRKNKHHAKHLQSAWNKYGAHTFSFRILLFCAFEDVLFYEQRAIDGFNSANPEFGYNSSPTAGNTAGVVFTEERLRRMSAALKGKVQSAEAREKKRIASTGRKATEETRAKLVAVARALALDPIFREKMREGCRRRVYPPTWNENLSKAKKGKKANIDPEVLRERNRKIGEANRVRVLGLDAKRNMSEAQKNRAGVARFLFKGEMRTVSEIAALSGLSRYVVGARIRMGWPSDRLGEPLKIVRAK